ncbi:MAG TPA: caspase family protein [Vicinamibacterales bacterium]|nr:caspase family protein [Vicinamibacterales bacterium]
MRELVIGILFLLSVAGRPVTWQGSRQPQSLPELVIQTGHSLDVRAVDVSPNGRLAATGSQDGTIKLWDLKNLTQLRTLTGHTREVYSVVFSPDGSRLVSSSDDRTIVAWNVGTGRKIWTATRPDRNPKRLRFSGDGRAVISTGVADDGPSFWDAATGAYLRSHPAGASVDGLSISRDGRYLAMGAIGTVFVQDAATGATLRNLTGFGGVTDATALDSGSQWVAAAAGDGRVYVWHLAGTGERRLLTGVSNVWDFDLSPDGSRLAACSFSGVSLLNTTTWAVERTLKGNCRAVAFNPQGTLLVASDGRSARVWDARSWSELGQIGRAFRAVQSAAVSNDARWIATPGESKIAVWDTLSGEVTRVLEGFKYVTVLTFGAGGALLTAGGGHNDRAVRTWDVTTGRETGPSVTDLPYSVSSIDFGRNGQLLATAGYGITQIWDLSAGKLLGAVAANQAGAVVARTDVAFRPGGGMLAIANVTGGLELWDLGAPRPRRPSFGQLAGEGGHLTQFSPDGRTLALGASRGEIALYDIASERKVTTFRTTEALDALVFSHDGQRLAAGTATGTIVIWNIATGSPVATLRGHTARVNSLAFSVDHRWLFSTSDDGTVRLWEGQSGQHRATIIYFDGTPEPEWLVVAPDGLFDGTANAMEYVGWRLGDDTESGVAPISTFFNDYNYPALLAEIMRGGTPRARHDIVTQLRLPGLRTMIAQGHAEIRRTGGKLVLCLAEEPVIDTLQLYRSGEPTATTSSDFVRSPDARCAYRREVADDGQQYELAATPMTTRVDAAPSPWDRVRSTTAQSTLHVQVIGIDAYPAGSGWRRLRWAVADAVAFHRFFTAQSARSDGPYQRVHVWDGLYDRTATREGIRSRLRDMARAMRPEDVAFVFMSGHGAVPLGEQMFYFMPADIAGAGPAQQRRSGLNTAMLAQAVREMQGRRVVLVIDACQSGGALESVQKVAEMKARIELRRQPGPPSGAAAAASAVGVHVITAATPLQDAVERRREGRGLLTSALFEALQNRQGPDGTVWIRTVLDHVRVRLPELAKQSGERQTPFMVSVGADFPIAR